MLYCTGLGSARSLSISEEDCEGGRLLRGRPKLGDTSPPEDDIRPRITFKFKFQDLGPKFWVIH